MAQNNFTSFKEYQHWQMLVYITISTSPGHVSFFSNLYFSIILLILSLSHSSANSLRIKSEYIKALYQDRRRVSSNFDLGSFACSFGLILRLVCFGFISGVVSVMTRVLFYLTLLNVFRLRIYEFGLRLGYHGHYYFPHFSNVLK